MAVCSDCGLLLSRSVNGGQCPLCARRDLETTFPELDPSEKTLVSAPAPEVTTLAKAPELTTLAKAPAPASLAGFLAAVGEPPPPPAPAPARAPAPWQKVAPIAPPPPPAPKAAAKPAAPPSPPVPIPGLNPVPMPPKAPPPPPPVTPTPPRKPAPSEPAATTATMLGPKPLPAPAAFSAAVAAIPAAPPLVTATIDVPPPEPPPLEPAAFAPSVSPFESVTPTSALHSRAGAIVSGAFDPFAASAAGTAPPSLEPAEPLEPEPPPPMAAPFESVATMEMSSIDLEALEAGPMEVVSGSAVVVDERPEPVSLPPPPVRERDTMRPRPVESTQVSRMPPRAGIAPSLAAGAVVGALVIGFFGGRFTAPSDLAEPVAIASTPVPAVSIAAVAAHTPKHTATPSTAVAIASTPKSTARLAATESAMSGALADASALAAAGKTDQAIAALDVILKAEPSNAEAHWAMAGAYRAKKKGPQGCQEFRAYAKHAPSGAHAAEAKRHLAVCSAVTLLDQEKLDEAHAAFEAIVKKNKNFADGYYWLGTMRALRNENAAACESFMSYINLDSNGPYVDRVTAQLGALGC